MPACLVILVLCLLLGCTATPEPVPPVPPPPDDLSGWILPELVQPLADIPPARPPEDKPTKAEQVALYTPGTIYTVPVAVGTPLDIVLEHGENVRNIVAGGRAAATEGEQKTSAIEIKEGASGNADTLQSHIFVRATEGGTTMGAIITTTARVYLLTLKAVKESPIRLLRWRYPVTATVHASAEKPDSVLPDPLTPRRWHVGYAISHGGHAPDWQPMATWDDGKKMYVLLPITALYGVSPVIRGIGPNGPMLLNSRQYQNVIVIDQLAPRLELRVGIGEQAEVVTIARSALETIDCPGESRCPIWPSPSTTLRRQR